MRLGRGRGIVLPPFGTVFTNADCSVLPSLSLDSEPPSSSAVYALGSIFDSSTIVRIIASVFACSSIADANTVSSPMVPPICSASNTFAASALRDRGPVTFASEGIQSGSFEPSERPRLCLRGRNPGVRCRYRCGTNHQFTSSGGLIVL